MAVDLAEARLAPTVAGEPVAWVVTAEAEAQEQAEEPRRAEHEAEAEEAEAEEEAVEGVEDKQTIAGKTMRTKLNMMTW